MSLSLNIKPVQQFQHVFTHTLKLLCFASRMGVQMQRPCFFNIRQDVIQSSFDTFRS